MAIFNISYHIAYNILFTILLFMYIPYLAVPLVGGRFTYVGIPYTQTDGRTDGWTDGRMDGQQLNLFFYRKSTAKIRRLLSVVLARIIKTEL